jgi:hypothetical protein
MMYENVPVPSDHVHPPGSVTGEDVDSDVGSSAEPAWVHAERPRARYPLA